MIVPAAGSIHHVHDQVLAAALLMLGVPLKTDLVGRAWPGVSNVYSAENPARVNGVRVPGKVTYFFQGRTADGSASTKQLIGAWEAAGNLDQENGQPQGIREINRITAKLRDPKLGEAERNRLCDEMDFWQAVSHIQAVRVALLYNRDLSLQALNPHALPVLARDKLPGKTRFLPLSASQL